MDKTRGRARWPAMIATMLLLWACTGTGPVSTGGNATASPGVSSSPSSSPQSSPQVARDGPLWFTVLGEPGEAILLRMSSDGAGPLRFVVAGAAGEREVAQVANPVAGIEGGWIRSAAANQAGLVALVVEAPVDQRRLVAFDLNLPGTPAYETPGDPWHALGPRGLIAIAQATEADANPQRIVVTDLGSSSSTPQVYTVPEGLMATGLSADGAGLVAGRQGDGIITFGMLGPDGSFVAGDVHPVYVTGLEQYTGPSGQILGFTHGDGQGWSSMAITARTGGDDVVWYASRSDTGEPEPIGAAWDPAGRGLWVVLNTPAETRLALFREPFRPTVIAAVPRTAGDEESGPPTILGIHPNGGTVAFGRPGNGEGAEFGPAGRTTLIDIETGGMTEHDGAFVGWAGWSAP